MPRQLSAPAIGLAVTALFVWSAVHASSPADTPAVPADPHAGHTAPAPPAVDASLAAAAFERFKRLEGEWVGRSTKGWTDTATYRTIAAGSVVMSTSFDAHPNETMLTTFHLDGSRLMLTHYCVARNQPRLVASEISGDGSGVTFTFLDGTGLASRDAGHMDKAVFRFLDDGRFTSRWTWYQNGEERWMEDIHYERRSADPLDD